MKKQAKLKAAKRAQIDSERNDAPKANERKFYGAAAVKELFRVRKQDIVRVYIAEPLIKEFPDLLAWCAREKKAYHVIPAEELDAVSASKHHEGICVLAKAQAPADFDELVESAPSDRCCLLYLEGVGNPHNFGSILRVGANFGVLGVLGKRGDLPGTSGAAGRVAEGGAEHVLSCEVEDPADAIETLREEGFTVVATSSYSKRKLSDFRFAARTVLLIGSEGAGLSPGLAKLADFEVAIDGSGNVESLNVATATAVLLNEFVRQHGVHVERKLIPEARQKFGKPPRKPDGIPPKRAGAAVRERGDERRDSKHRSSTQNDSKPEFSKPEFSKSGHSKAGYSKKGHSKMGHAKKGRR